MSSEANTDMQARIIAFQAILAQLIVYTNSEGNFEKTIANINEQRDSLISLFTEESNSSHKNMGDEIIKCINQIFDSSVNALNNPRFG